MAPFPPCRQESASRDAGLQQTVAPKSSARPTAMKYSGAAEGKALEKVVAVVCCVHWKKIQSCNRLYDALITRSRRVSRQPEGQDVEHETRTAKRRRTDGRFNSVYSDEEARSRKAVADDTFIAEDIRQPAEAKTVPTSTQNDSSEEEDHEREITGQYTPRNRASTRMKLDSLPVLDNLSSQMISLHAKFTHQEVMTMITDPTAERGREYAHVRSLFEHAKQIYATATPFLSPEELELRSQGHIDVLRKANLATFISSTFGHNIPLETLDERFLDVFVPEGGRLLKLQASLWLELKTQVFIATIANGDKQLHVKRLAQIFDENVERRILRRRPGARGLAPSEHDFIKRLIARREFLVADMMDDPADTLAEKYRWDDFLREMTAYVSKSSESVSGLPDRNDAYGGRLSGAVAKPGMPQGLLEGQFSIHRMPTAAPTPTPKPPPQPLVAPPKEDFVARAARAAQIALQGQDMPFSSPRPTPPLNRSEGQPATQPYSQVDPQFQHYTPPTGPNQSSRAHRHAENVPHSSQTAPTQVLYERARMATTAKIAPMARKTNTPSQRRPWTSEEEQALMEGLDRVRGPHWSQILGMFGPGGTENEKLKDRNQVQLKDKARNLKLFFLKSGIEVPFYLKYVTGDLKTRAPAQASKQEARERARLQGEEDRAHFDGIRGIMALAGQQQIPMDVDRVPESESPLIAAPPMTDEMAMQALMGAEV